MKPTLLAFVAVLLVSTPVLAMAGYGETGSSNAAAGLEKLKTLAGEWETSGALDGTTTRIIYQVVSNGTAVMETIFGADEPNMITVYHVDGERLMMTHYCALGNQPRMRASVPAGAVNELVFKFVDGSNMKKNDKHMHNLTMTFVDDTHVKAVWSLYDKGKLAQDVEFTYARTAQ